MSRDLLLASREDAVGGSAGCFGFPFRDFDWKSERARSADEAPSAAGLSRGRARAKRGVSSAAKSDLTRCLPIFQELWRAGSLVDRSQFFAICGMQVNRMHGVHRAL